MKILITGAGGQLGSELCAQLLAGESPLGELPALYKGSRVLPFTAGQLDITDELAVIRTLRSEQPELVINCAAFTNVDACEGDERKAYAVNAQGPEYLARACAQLNAKLLHISTDYVFDGTAKTPYTEEDVCHPMSVYGKSKLAGERLVEARCPRAVIVRTAWLYGGTGVNFLKTILRLANERDSICVVNDQIGCPTLVGDLAYAILRLNAAAPFGTFHITGAGQCSWYDFAKEIVRLSGLACQVNPCTSAEFPRPAPRPAYSVLSNEKLSRTIESPMRPWQEALAQFMAELRGAI